MQVFLARKPCTSTDDKGQILMKAIPSCRNPSTKLSLIRAFYNRGRVAIRVTSHTNVGGGQRTVLPQPIRVSCSYSA